MTRLILQTSRHKPQVPMWDSLKRFAKGWDYAHFDDSEILQFFKNNPIPGFEDIEKRFKEIRRGEHRADLFRYYYIYLNGGFFVDSDLELKENLDDVVGSYDFVTAEIKAYEPGVLNVTKRSRGFNGYMYASKPKNPIILQCLQHLYHIDIDDLGPEDGSWDTRYHLVCEYLYNVIQAYPDKSNIKVYKITDNNGSFISDGKKILAQHFPSQKENMPALQDNDFKEDLRSEYLEIKEDLLSKNGPILYYCGVTAITAVNSGIQRYVRKTAKALMELGVDIIPVIYLNNELVPLTPELLQNMANFNGPPVSRWHLPKEFLDKSKIFKNAKTLIYPELPLGWSTRETENVIRFAHKKNIKVVSIFHDAIAYLLKDYYSTNAQELFLGYMNELSESDMIVSVSKSSKVDYDSIMKSPRNETIESLALPLPHNVDTLKLPEPKQGGTRTVNILCVSALENRKNHIRLLQAYHNVRRSARARGIRTNMTFIAAYDGLEASHSARVKKLCQRLGVELIINASEDQLREKYHRADFTIYPSVYEGFGLPIVESLQFNTPIICSNTSSMKEIADEFGLPTFDPHNVEDIAMAMEEMIMDKDKRRSIMNNVKKVKPYSWNDYAIDLLKIL
jgi:glycosyltransferase involved in cell wall biosynthesis